MKPFWKAKQIQLRWNEPLGEKDCPYAYRWVFIFFGYSIRIHHFLRSDDKRYMHDHAWWFTTLILKGSYTDVSKDANGNEIREVLNAGDIRHREANHAHYVQVEESGCWTILVTGKPMRNWGFWVKGKMMRPLRYFSRYGHPPCSEQ